MRSELGGKQRLFTAQTELLQRFLNAQGALLGNALLQADRSVRYELPSEVLILEEETGRGRLAAIATGYRTQKAGSLADRLAKRDLFTLLRQQLFDLEHSADQAVSTGAALVRHACAMHLVDSLAVGQPVKYIAAGGEAIPTIPVGEVGERAPDGQGDYPFPRKALQFYLPQWIAFDGQGRLLVESVEEAEILYDCMQGYLSALQMTSLLAPYLTSDAGYKAKRYGMLGQLVNQGRALARFQTRQIIERIWRRAAANTLNRGMSLSLPYFDDLELRLKTYDFEVIPKGRVLFVPAFVVCAVREVEEKVAQDPAFSSSTRNHLLAELRVLERAFQSGSGPSGGGRRVKLIKPGLSQAELNYLVDPSI